MSKHTLDVLVSDGIIERVDPDPDPARQELQAARSHVESAALIAGRDPTGAFAMAHAEALVEAIEVELSR